MILLIYIFSVFLLIVMVVLGLLAAEHKDLLTAAVSMGLVSLLASLIFYILQAPDVAITEASIGAGLGMAVVVFGIKNTVRWEK